MKIRSYRHIALATLLLTGGAVTIRAEESARPRSAAINFSGPKSDTVSTNLNELRTPVSPFQELESNLKSPFETLEKPRPGADFRESRRLIQQNQTFNRKTRKASLNERAEQMFLNPELYEGDKGDEAFFQLNKDSIDPYKKKPTNSLERYNDRQERDRMVLTNRAANKNLFGEKNPGRPDDWQADPKMAKPFKTGGYLDEDRNDSLSLFPRAATNSSSLGAESSAPARNLETFNRPLESPIGRRNADAEARLEDFKRLLEGPRYTPPTKSDRSSAAASAGNYGAPTANNNPSRATAPAASNFEWSTFKPAPKDEPRDDFATSAGLVGKLEKPQGLPEFSSATKPLSSMTTTPSPATLPVKTLSNPTFKIPQRRF